MYELSAKLDGKHVNKLRNLSPERFEQHLTRLLQQREDLRRRQIRIWAKDPQGIIHLLWNS